MRFNGDKIIGVTQSEAVPTMEDPNYGILQGWERDCLSDNCKIRAWKRESKVAATRSASSDAISPCINPQEFLLAFPYNTKNGFLTLKRVNFNAWVNHTKYFCFIQLYLLLRRWVYSVFKKHFLNKLAPGEVEEGPRER